MVNLFLICSEFEIQSTFKVWCPRRSDEYCILSTIYFKNSKLQKIPDYGQLQPFPDSPFPTQDDYFGQNQFQTIQPITPEQVQPEVQPEVQLEVQPEIQPEI